MNPHDQYKKNSATGWARIDMLLELYNAALTNIESGLDELGTQETESKIPIALLKAQSQIGGLISGIDLDQGDVAKNIFLLLEYAFGRVASNTKQGCNEALSVLRTLADAFTSIQREASALEESGAIPKPSDQAIVQRIA